MAFIDFLVVFACRRRRRTWRIFLTAATIVKNWSTLLSHIGRKPIGFILSNIECHELSIFLTCTNFRHLYLMFTTNQSHSFLSQVTLVKESLVFALVIPLQSFRLRSQSTNRKTLFHLKLICRLCKTRLVWNMQASLVALNWIKWIYPTTINISWFSRSFFGIQLETVYFTST